MIPYWVLFVLVTFISLLSALAVYWLQDKNKIGALWGFTGVAILACIGAACYVHNGFIEDEIGAKTPVYFGFLEPSDEPSPTVLRPDQASLLLGDNLQVLTKSISQRVLSAHGSAFLTVSIEKGKLWISTTITDFHNQTIVRVIKNEFQALPENAFNPVQPDKHTLLVRDTSGAEVLRLHFLNPRCIFIAGRFSLPNGKTVVVNANGFALLPDNITMVGFTLDLTNTPNAGAINIM